jgi:hypothetical protein
VIKLDLWTIEFFGLKTILLLFLDSKVDKFVCELQDYPQKSSKISLPNERISAQRP